MMTQEQSTRQKWWFLAGCGLACLASLGLVACVVAPQLMPVSDTTVFSLVCGAAVLMGVGATFAIFNLRKL